MLILTARGPLVILLKTCVLYYVITYLQKHTANRIVSKSKTPTIGPPMYRAIFSALFEAPDTTKRQIAYVRANLQASVWRQLFGYGKIILG